MRRLSRLYYRQGGENFVLWEAVPGHPLTVAINKAIVLGEATVLGKFYPDVTLKADYAIWLISFRGKRFALLQRIDYENPV